MLTEETLKLLPDDLKNRLSEFEKTFSTKGWNFVSEWASKTADEIKHRLLFCQSWEEYQNLQGRWFAFTELANLEVATYNEFEAIAAQIEESTVSDFEIEYE